MICTDKVDSPAERWMSYDIKVLMKHRHEAHPLRLPHRRVPAKGFAGGGSVPRSAHVQAADDGTRPGCSTEAGRAHYVMCVCVCVYSQLD